MAKREHNIQLLFFRPRQSSQAAGVHWIAKIDPALVGTRSHPAYSTGESPTFGTREYFAKTPAMTRRIYPRIALFDNQPETGLDRQLEKVGYSLEDIDEPAGRSVCVAGDAAFSDDQLARGGVPGITESLTDLRKTHESLRTYRDARDTVFVYGHDTTNEAKLSAVFEKGNGAVL